MEPTELSLSDYLEILRRRKWSLILPFFLIFVPVVAVAILLPSVYQSTATILIEEQDIPSDFVMATVTSYAEQRIQAINQRIMSSTRLMEVINRFRLYQHLRNKRTMEEIVAMMKEDVKLSPISADVVDRRTGRASTAMIAFNLSYEGRETPETVAQVANKLTSLFLQENIRVRQHQTQETSRFLEEELDKLRFDLEATEKQIADFKNQHINELPELLSVNQQSVYNLERESSMINEQLRGLREREGIFASQLANIKPHLEDKDENQQRLAQLKLQLSNLRSQFSEQYPDVVKLKSEIAEVEKQAAESGTKSSDRPDNPAYINLSSQLSGVRAEIRSMRQQMSKINQRKENYNRRIAATPHVEEEYKVFLSKRNNLQAKHDDLTRKLMEAKVSVGLEKEQKGERFTLIDPPRVPEKPFKPNRMAIILIGFVLGLGMGVGTAALQEFVDDSVRNADELVQATSIPVLAIVPNILTAKDINKRRITWLVVIVCLVAAVVIGVAVFHYMVMDLNVFWAKLMRRMMLLF
jgi:polysaccharide biosynthesis transport protein